MIRKNLFAFNIKVAWGGQEIIVLAIGSMNSFQFQPLQQDLFFLFSYIKMETNINDTTEAHFESVTRSSTSY